MERNLLLKIQYDGSAYHGWQVQENARSVQGVFQEALKQVLHTQPDIKACSRTDTGVHAREFCLSMKLSHNIPPERLLGALNHFLPPDIRKLLEGEDRHLDGRIRRSRIEARAVAEVGELHAEADLCSEVAHGHARDLAEVRNRSRSTRVDLDNVDFAVHDDVLQVDEADGLELRAEYFGRLDNLCAELVVDILCRVDRDAVAGVDTGALYVLHDARDEDVLAVADGVDFPVPDGAENRIARPRWRM